jgi:hypothetical protein
VRHDFPDGYRPSAFCRSCGRDFAGDTYFDRHRTGSHEHVFSLGHPDGRRCRDDDELRAVGLRPMTEEEMRAGRHRRRVGYGIEMWFDPVSAQRKAQSASRAFNEAHRGV